MALEAEGFLVRAVPILEMPDIFTGHGEDQRPTHSQMSHTGRGESAGGGYQDCGRISIPWFPESLVTWKVVLHSKKLTTDTGPIARIICVGTPTLPFINC